MNPVRASERWQRRQVRILQAAYVAAWREGEQAFKELHPGAKLPAKPAAQTMRQTLAPALRSVVTIGVAVAQLSPTPQQIAEAGSAQRAYATAVAAYVETHSWRLAASVYALWSAEQAGYAEAADQEGLLLKWQLDPSPNVEHCDDCPALADLPPMPLSMWPTLPGMGATECNVGCRCSMVAMLAPVPTLTAEQEEVLRRVSHIPVSA